MFRCACMFLIVAVAAAFLVFTGIAGQASGVVEIIAILSLVLFLVSLLLGRQCRPLFRK